MNKKALMAGLFSFSLSVVIISLGDFETTCGSCLFNWRYWSWFLPVAVIGFVYASIEE